LKSFTAILTRTRAGAGHPKTKGGTRPPYDSSCDRSATTRQPKALRTTTTRRSARPRRCRCDPTPAPSAAPASS
jgi:hypothetical protein